MLILLSCPITKMRNLVSLFKYVAMVLKKLIIDEKLGNKLCTGKTFGYLSIDRLHF